MDISYAVTNPELIEGLEGCNWWILKSTEANWLIRGRALTRSNYSYVLALSDFKDVYLALIDRNIFAQQMAEFVPALEATQEEVGGYITRALASHDLDSRYEIVQCDEDTITLQYERLLSEVYLFKWEFPCARIPSADARQFLWETYHVQMVYALNRATSDGPPMGQTGSTLTEDSNQVLTRCYASYLEHVANGQVKLKVEESRKRRNETPEFMKNSKRVKVEEGSYNETEEEEQRKIQLEAKLLGIKKKTTVNKKKKMDFL